MSGRSGYRKTARRRPRPANPAARAWQRLASGALPRLPAAAKPDHRAVFMLPAGLAFAVAPGAHGHGVMVGDGGLVEVAGRSLDHVILLASEFLAVIARDRLPFSVPAVVGRHDRPGGRDRYHVTWAGTCVVVSRCALEPAIVEAARR